MRNLSIVFRYELKNQLLKKSLIMTTVLLSLLVFAATFAPRIIAALSSGDGAPAQADAGQLVEGVGYASTDQALLSRLEKELGLQPENLYPDRASLVQALRGGKLKVGFVLTDPLTFESVWQDKPVDATEDRDLAALLKSLYVNDRLAERNITLAELTSLQATEAAVSETVMGKSSGNSIFLAFALLFVVYLVVLIYGSVTATMIAREKDSKTMELLITSCKPSALILGKVAASGVSAVLQTGVILLCAYIGYRINLDTMPPVVVAMLSGTLTRQYVLTYLFYSLAGYILYLFLYAALGSTVSKVEDVNNATGLVQMVFVLGYLAASFAMNSPNSGLSVAASIFPFTSLMVMPLRSALVTVPPWQHLAAGGLLVASLLLFALLSIRIYRWGTLNYGNKKGLIGALKGILSGK